MSVSRKTSALTCTSAGAAALTQERATRRLVPADRASPLAALNERAADTPKAAEPSLDHCAHPGGSAPAAVASNVSRPRGDADGARRGSSGRTWREAKRTFFVGAMTVPCG